MFPLPCTVDFKADVNKLATMPSEHLVHDLHVHTHFSPDSKEQLDSYARAGQQNSCHVGFSDHFELAFQERRGYLSEGQLPLLLEEFDKTQSRYPETSISLEVDYYSNLSLEVAEFCDNQRQNFDYLIGCVHCVNGLAVTSQKEMALLVQRLGLLGVLRKYFDEVESLIRSRLFNGLAHIDAVMRFVPLYKEEFSQASDYWYQRTLELGKLCEAYDLPVEINLTGLNYPWGRLHPDKVIVDLLIKSGTRFFIGSDSHEIESFVKTVPLVRQLNDYLRKRGALQLLGDIVSP